MIVELALRQQLATYEQEKPKPRLTPLDRAFWVTLSRLWPRWKQALVIVQPYTVVRWHRKGEEAKLQSRLYWRWISRPGPGRPVISPEVRALAKQLREAFPNDSVPRYLIFDNDSIFSDEVSQSIISLGITPKRRAFRSPWENGTAERWVGTCKRELIDHVVVLGEDHLRRLLHHYITYYNADRVHTCLADTPNGRPVEVRPSLGAKVAGLPRVGGLHHRDVWKTAV